MTLVVREGTRCQVQRCWEGRTVVCIAGGPSVTEASIERVRAARAAGAVRVLAVNDAYLLAPWADAAYFADARWWHQQGTGLERRWPWLAMSAAQVSAAREEFPGPWLSIRHPNEIKDPRVFLLENVATGGLSPTPYGVCTGANSGFQALNIAVHAGAAVIVLLGYDMRHDGKRTHVHNGHKGGSSDALLREMAVCFKTLEKPLAALGVRVLNCSPGTRITSFPVVPLAEALDCVPMS